MAKEVKQDASLCTARLRLIPASFDLIQAEMEEPDRFAQMLDANVPRNWPPEHVADVLPFFMEQLRQRPELRGWLGWYWVLSGETRESSTLVGSGGFKGSPNQDGMVEVGYSVLPQFRRLGYATEAVAGLLFWAFAHVEVTTAMAETSRENVASPRVLRTLGFQPVEGATEPGFGRFELTKERWRER